MAYITKFNSSRIVRQVDDKLIDAIEHVYYKRTIGFLSDQEIKRLSVYRKLLENADAFFEQFYMRIHDTETYMFENMPSFHKDQNCFNLHSKFDNIKIPDKIKERGKVAIAEFRKWAKENHDLFVNNRDAFKARCCMKFQLVHPTDMHDVAGDNSGVDFKKNYDLNELEAKIDKIIGDARTYYYSSDEVKTILKAFRNKMFLRLEKYPIQYNRTPYSEGSIKAVLQAQYSNFNEPLVWLLQEWLRVSFNPELSFSGRLLEQLGFKNCPVCYSDYNPADNPAPLPAFRQTTPAPTPAPRPQFDLTEPLDDLPF